MDAVKPYPHILRKAQIAAAAATFSHPWNPASQITGTQLSRMGGLERSGVSLARLAPGKESFAYHLHHTEEEWVYILSGRAAACIDGATYELAAGDFVAFPAPSVAHNIANSGTEDLIYLMGGENHAFEVSDFPALDRRMVRLHGTVQVYRLSDGRKITDV
jgi:uncharacterized cupin superfamily protein